MGVWGDRLVEEGEGEICDGWRLLLSRQGWRGGARPCDWRNGRARGCQGRLERSCRKIVGDSRATVPETYIVT